MDRRRIFGTVFVMVLPLIVLALSIYDTFNCSITSFTSFLYWLKVNDITK